MRPPEVVLAIHEPGVRKGIKDYRSFYVDDEVYARFRAALYWLGRNPAVVRELGSDNMSGIIERWMANLATDLENRFNGGEIFEMPPPTRRRRDTSQPSSRRRPREQ